MRTHHKNPPVYLVYIIFRAPGIFPCDNPSLSPPPGGLYTYQRSLLGGNWLGSSSRGAPASSADPPPSSSAYYGDEVPPPSSSRPSGGAPCGGFCSTSPYLLDTALRLSTGLAILIREARGGWGLLSSSPGLVV